jgi:hypothetical protein
MSGKTLRARFRRFGLRWLMLLAGFVSLVWFLVRVIPKPSRAAYPCQRAAFPLASAFVLWLMQFAGLVLVVRTVRKLFKDSRFLAALSLAAVVVTVSFTAVLLPDGDGSWYVPSDAPLSPTGTPQGIHPGRVVWNYNPDATSWDGSTGKWWNYVDQGLVDAMLSDTLVDLAGAEDDADAWDLLFRHCNQELAKGDVGYRTNETVVIKLNLNRSNAHDYTQNAGFTAPQVALALLRQLIHEAGVDETDIILYDASRYVPDVIYDYCKAEFPGVRFADLYGGSGREQVQKDTVNGQIQWSDDLQDPTEIGGGHPAYLPTCVTQADYFINLANLKGHTLAGITICAKNHFGSFLADADEGVNVLQMPKHAGVHPYIAVHDFGGTSKPEWQFSKREMGTYNALVDLMGHADLGGKTILYLIDGLYASINQNYILGTDCKWQGKPFSDDDGWTSSLFVSQDPVAIDSVALDFLRSEATIQEYAGVMDAGDTVDNYLHEAARADDPPSGAFYDPEGDGTRMASLGVHEHWNNPVERLYSGNFAPGTGIQLIRSPRAPDADRDGLPDEWELECYGGITNANPEALCSNGRDTVMAAYVAGFDPNDPQAFFRISAQQFDTANTIFWGGVSGRVYSVYWSSDLLNGFQLLENQVHWTSNSFIDTQHPGSNEAFYKLHVDLITR